MSQGHVDTGDLHREIVFLKIFREQAVKQYNSKTTKQDCFKLEKLNLGKKKSII